ncbi:hypothetical protein [Subtercola frigoramans]|uniref:Membrane protein YeaQ/YmgE (Transglycosylase-associated protein family) n=1 Tax=Subtercola frigoramans TaxID=120298 RepID=A0ABS2L2Z9_9MICO|nr:hypothetical protein [Subtercola frigoramans]MBM7471460.1 putative membrane protein YeaQ/YmgE (transglycosylase-associated protein family) [Subtercola frigoramans]
MVIEQKGILLARSVVPVWLLALVGAVLVGVFSPPAQYFVYLPAVLGALVIVTFIVQLAFTHPEGFVDRVAAGVAGSFVILGLATAVLALVS